MLRIALIGDFDPGVTAHRAIPLALACAGHDLDLDVRYDWLHTSTLAPRLAALAAYDAVWCVPASPYADTDAAIDAIAQARQLDRPFLGTCAGFQHALLEYARNALGVRDAAHAELDPLAADPLIAPLSCSMVERTAAISFVPGSRIARAYGAQGAVEGYHCRYGLSRRFEHLIGGGPLRVTGRDTGGEVRAVELEHHSFFVATLFQPERRALRGITPPLVRALLEAAAR